MNQQNAETEFVIETANDFQDKNLARLKKFEPATRKLSSSQPEIDANGSNKSNFQSIDHIMDKKLILLVIYIFLLWGIG